MRLKRTLLLAMIPVIGACADRSVQYYKDHPQEREERLLHCVDDPSQDCTNLRQAAFEARGIPAKNGTAIMEKPR